MRSFSSPQVVCRPALPGDKPDVLEFTKFIWDGHDYIQYVWDDWLADPQGLMAVAEYGGHAVALGKITLLSPGQWWVEGVRVDPKHQGLKIGTHIFRYLDDWWREQGGAVRYMTSSERLEMHHLGERFGYRKVGEVRSFTAPPLAEAGHGLQPVRADEIKEALRFASAHWMHLGGLMDSGWRFSAPDEGVLRELVGEGRLHWWGSPLRDLTPGTAYASLGTLRAFPKREGVPAGSGSLLHSDDKTGLLAHWDDDYDGERMFGIGFAACAADQLAAMLMDVRRLAADRGYTRLVWLSPEEQPVAASLTEAGYATDWDTNGWVYEKRAVTSYQ